VWPGKLGKNHVFFWFEGFEFVWVVGDRILAQPLQADCQESLEERGIEGRWIVGLRDDGLWD
jgi:hypothetical protein